jgi:hypothetical protein
VRGIGVQRLGLGRLGNLDFGRLLGETAWGGQEDAKRRKDGLDVFHLFLRKITIARRLRYLRPRTTWKPANGENQGTSAIWYKFNMKMLSILGSLAFYLGWDGKPQSHAAK